MAGTVSHTACARYPSIRGLGVHKKTGSEIDAPAPHGDREDRLMIPMDVRKHVT